MPVVTSFKIQFDLNLINTLYDGMTGVMHHRPPQGWDVQELKAQIDRTDTSPKPSRETLSQALKLLLSHKEKICWEKQVLNKSKAIMIDLFAEDCFPQLPVWVLPVLQPGHILKGNVTLETTALLELLDINIQCLGYAWSKIVSGSYHHRSTRIDRQFYINTRKVLWPQGRDDTVDADVSCFSSSGSKKSFLQPGRYCFPFQFVIPPQACASLPIQHPKGSDEFKICYFLKASLNKGNCCKRGNFIVHHALWVDRKIDIAYHLSPVTKDVVQSTGLLGNAGDITIHLRLPRKGYIRGETIPISLEINNGSSDIISQVSAQISLIGAYKTRSKIWSKSREFAIGGLVSNSGPISPGMCPALSLKVPFSFPRVNYNLLPTGTLAECEIIDLAYVIHVVVRRPGLTLNKSFNVPIFVGTYNSRYIQGDTDFNGPILFQPEPFSAAAFPHV